MDMKEFVEGLTPEQNGKLKACKSADEIVGFAKSEKLALPDDFLEKIAGGSVIVDPTAEPFKEPPIICPYCGNDDQDLIANSGGGHYCLACFSEFC